jgi:hypothetical protein
MNDFSIVPDTGVGNTSSVAVADFYGTGTYAAVYGDFTYGPNYRYDPAALRGIYLYKLADRKPTGNAIAIGTPYFDRKPQYASYPSFMEPQKTHTVRVWVDDFNHDAKLDIVTQGQIWHASAGPQKNILQMFRNDGAYAFTDVTDELNPDYNENCHQHEYQPQLRDVDGSGINTYLLATPSYNPSQPPCNYVLVNDGTGRLHVALHEILNTYGRQILKWATKSRELSGLFVQHAPQLRAYRTSNGLLNFVAMLPAVTQPGQAPYVNRWVFVNVPIQLDLRRQFTAPLTVKIQNGSHRIRGFAGDDIFYISDSGDVSIDGGLGMNTVVYEGPKERYATANVNGAWRITDTAFARTDTLTRIQRVVFADSGRALQY